MRFSKVVPRICCAALLFAASSDVRAQMPTTPNRLTYLTFSGPVTLPGVTLPAGKYAFQTADTWSGRNIIQVLNEDRSRMIKMFLTIPDQRMEVTQEPTVMFKETPEGMPPAVKSWFYPGERTGNEFVYPRRQAELIARASKESVAATSDELTDVETMKTAEISRVDPSGRETAVDEAEAETEPQASARGQYGQEQTPRPADQTAPERAATPRPEMTTAQREPSPTLPQTASYAPLVGVAGLMGLIGAFVLGAWRRR